MAESTRPGHDIKAHSSVFMDKSIFKGDKSLLDPSTANLAQRAQLSDIVIESALKFVVFTG